MRIADGRLPGRLARWVAFQAPPRAEGLVSLIGTGLFIWLLLTTTVEGFSAAEFGLSRTREIMTVYVVVAVTLFRRPWRWWPRYLKYAAASLVVLVSVGYISWLLDLGSALAINFWAQWMIPVAAFFLGLSFLPGLWPTWRRVLLVYGCAIAAYQAAILLLRIGAAAPEPGSTFYAARTISATLAMVLVVAMVLAATEQRIDPRTRNILAGLLGASAILAQHRTVWIALVIACALLALRSSRVGRSSAVVLGPALSFGFLVVAAVLPLVTRVSLLPSGEVGEVEGGLPSSFEDTNTLGWRWDMWVSRMQADRSWTEWLVGGMFGETPAWGPHSDVLVPLISSHSMFVDLLSMLGLVGLAVFLFLVVVAVTRRGNRLSAAVVIVWALLAYGIFNQWPPYAWLVLAAALVTSDESVGTSAPSTLAVPRGSGRAGSAATQAATLDDGAR